MSTITTLQNASDRLPKDLFIGNIAWYTVSDDIYDFDRLKELFAQNDLDETFLPRRNSAADVFKRATRIGNGRKFTTARGYEAHFLVRDVTRDADHRIQHLVCELVDSSSQRLSYRAVATLTYHRGRNGGKPRAQFVRTDEFDPDVNAAIDQVLADMKVEFNRRYDTMANSKLRHVIGTYMSHLMCISIRPSVRFIPAAHQREMDGLINVLRGMGCEAQTLPLVNVTDQLEMVQKAYYDTQKNDLTELVVDMTSLADGLTVTPAEFNRMKERYDTMMTRATAYENDLRCQSSVTEGVQDAAKAALRRLTSALLAGGVK